MSYSPCAQHVSFQSRSVQESGALCHQADLGTELVCVPTRLLYAPAQLTAAPSPQEDVLPPKRDLCGVHHPAECPDEHWNVRGTDLDTMWMPPGN